MPNLPLDRHEIVRTADADAAHDWIAHTYLEHRLSLADGRLSLRLHAWTDEVLTLGYVAYGGEATLTMPPTRDTYHVNLTLRGGRRGTGGTRPHRPGRARAAWCYSRICPPRWRGVRTRPS